MRCCGTMYGMKRITVRAVIAHDDKLLLVKLKAHINQGADFYCTVGGKLEEGEGLVEGLEREVAEETGITPEVGRLLYIQQFEVDGGHGLDFLFHVTNGPDYTDIDLSNTSHGEEEIHEIGFYDPSEVTVLPEFLKEVDLSRLDEVREVAIYNYL